MNALREFIWNSVKFMLFHFIGIFSILWKESHKQDIKVLAIDFLSVLKSVVVLCILNVLALLIFTLLPQGKDILLAIAEQVGVEHSVGSFFYLLVGLIIWSVVSEYATRYSIYVTDNSGKSLSDERVAWRKAVQTAISNLFLIAPYMIVLLGFLINYLNDSSLNDTAKNVGFGVPALVIYIVMNLISIVYYTFDEKENASTHSGNAGSSSNNPFLLFRNIIHGLGESLRQRVGRSDLEKEWCDKLFGIYNDYVFQIRKVENFKGEERATYQLFVNRFLELPEEGRKAFPQDETKLEFHSVVPQSFELIKFESDKDDNGRYLWSYRIPSSFYLRLHRQLLLLVGISVAFFLGICFANGSVCEKVGAPGLLMIAFACWTGIYLGVLFLDTAVFRSHGKIKWLAYIPLRFILLAVLLICSWSDEDHPVRYNETGKVDQRPTLRQHFTQWFNKYSQDTLHNVYICRNDPAKQFYPVVFVCAEGGALRTGAYASMLLSCMQDSLRDMHDIDFKKSIYAFSGVSGGSLGLAFFNAIAYLNTEDELKGTGSLVELTKSFYTRDHLAPIIGKMFFGDVLNLFSPSHIVKFDRAIALEQSWEAGYNDIYKARGFSFSSDFLSTYAKDNSYPALFINTTEAESGQQCWITSVKPDSSMFFGKDRDLMDYKLKGGINYSTAVNFSTRFPLFSPAVMVKENENLKHHYLDGGYAENTGSATMVEILKALRPIFNNKARKAKIIPYVIVLRYSDETNDTYQNINFGNELTEILNGIYNTRTGRVNMAVKELEQLVDQMHGHTITLKLDLSGSEVPMNWMLSRTALNNIERFVKKMIAEQREKNKFRRLFCVDSLSCSNSPKYKMLDKEYGLSTFHNSNILCKYCADSIRPYQDE